MSYLWCCADVMRAVCTSRSSLTSDCGVSDSIGGIMLMSWSSKDLHVDNEPLSAICSVMGAVMFALFLVLLRRRVDNEDKLNMPMFYGL